MDLPAQLNAELQSTFAELKKGGIPSLVPLLPLVFRLKGKPYTLDEHYQTESLFRTRLPKRLSLKFARQVSKTMLNSSRSLLLCAAKPNFSVLVFGPYFETVRRMSQTYVGPLVEQSPFRGLFVDKRQKTIGNVLQRTFPNGSKMTFSHVHGNPARTRGIDSDLNIYDEWQEFDRDMLDVIGATLDHSEYAGSVYSGTPKGLENAVEAEWMESSQAEWFIPCGCGRWNVPALGQDLLKMIGPYRKTISREHPGLVCAKCGRPVSPRRGHWRHAHLERRWSFPGYHLAQPAMSFHCEDPLKWRDILTKQKGDPTKFANECLGESSDVGARLVTLTDLKNAAVLPWRNRFEEAQKQMGRYIHRVLAVDWGGGGGSTAEGASPSQQRKSYTVLAALGLLPDGRIDVFWGLRSKRTHEPAYEAALCLRALKELGMEAFVNDYGGGSAAAEALVIQGGFPIRRTMPMRYHGGGRQGIVIEHPPSDNNPRQWYGVDKPRSLGVVCECVRRQIIRFFQYDYRSREEPGLIRDFLALVAEKADSRVGADVYRIIRDPTGSDDFAQAVNIGACALWHTTQSWPDLTAGIAAHYDLDSEMNNMDDESMNMEEAAV